MDLTLAEQRDRTFNERFATAADRLGAGRPAAVRLAGVYAMAGLADDRKQNRQTCTDVLCAYLRMPYEPDPGEEATARQRLEFRGNRGVRHTVIRVIATHLQQDLVDSWRGLNFDFTAVVFDGGSFEGAEFSGGKVSFSGAEFCSAEVSFSGAKFSGGQVDFRGAVFRDGKVSFKGVKFSGAEISFPGAEFSDGKVSFSAARFSDGRVNFGAGFSGSNVSFKSAEFSGGNVSFNAEFSRGNVSFHKAVFSGSKVTFIGTVFSGSEVDFSQVADWSHPPKFDWEGTPPADVTVPAATGGERMRRPVLARRMEDDAGPSTSRPALASNG